MHTAGKIPNRNTIRQMVVVFFLSRSFEEISIDGESLNQLRFGELPDIPSKSAPNGIFNVTRARSPAIFTAAPRVFRPHVLDHRVTITMRPSLILTPPGVRRTEVVTDRNEREREKERERDKAIRELSILKVGTEMLMLKDGDNPIVITDKEDW